MIDLERGLKGEVYLMSPTGEVRKIELPARNPRTAVNGGRVLWGSYDVRDHLKQGGKIVGVQVQSPWDRPDKSVDRRQKMFQRLLSKGWKIVGESTIMGDGEPDEWKKNTKEVNGSTRTGSQTHGGSHNSGEVDHAAETPSEKRRGNRGGRKKKADKDANGKMAKVTRRLALTGGGAVYAAVPLTVTAEVIASAEAAAKLLAQIVGSSNQVVEQGTRIDIERLLMALEIGDDPLPALAVPHERPNLKVLVTPDRSGSTQNWSGLACAFAIHLSKLPDVDVTYIDNSNGFWQGVDPVQADKVAKDADVVIYLGDDDGRDNCEVWAKNGATVLGMSTYCSTYGEPRLHFERHGTGRLFWVTGVDATAPKIWPVALELCVKKL